MTDIGTQPQGRVSLESRRSTRVALKVVIETQGTQGIAGHLTWEGETIIVNLHGALITTSVALSVGMKIEIHVYLTGKRATAKVVYVDPEKPLLLWDRVSDTTEHLGNLVAPKRLAGKRSSVKPHSGVQSARDYSLSQKVMTVVVALLALTACKSGFSIDRAAAQRVGDSFMSDLVADRVSGAISKMEPEIVQTLGQDQAEAAVRKLFDYCGRPLDSEFKHDEIGFKVYANGNQKPMRTFYYAATTTQYPKKGECFFAVEVVPADAGFKVTTFGPLRLQSGQLPEWLR